MRCREAPEFEVELALVEEKALEVGVRLPKGRTGARCSIGGAEGATVVWLCSGCSIKYCKKNKIREKRKHGWVP
jgi:hypothetical protein